MSVSESQAGGDPVDGLAEEFVARLRRKESPTIEEYAEQYPQWAERIRQVFAALIVMERLKPQANDNNTQSTAEGSTNTQYLMPTKIGDYRIIRELGRGGMGIVYEAEQMSLGRHVALKVLQSSAIMEAKHIARFEREARAAGQLHHTNIVPIFGVGHEGHLHYYVMQFIQGQPLSDVLDEVKWLEKERSSSLVTRNRGRSAGKDQQATAGGTTERIAVGLLSGEIGENTNRPVQSESPVGVSTVRDKPTGSVSDSSAALPGETEISSVTNSDAAYFKCVARLGVQVAEALEYAHEKGVLHRDIKPANLLLDHHGKVWVTDFGLARVLEDDHLTGTGDVVGTLRYMPPEAFGGGYEPSSDIFGLALALYEMIALRPAYDAIDRSSLMRQATSGEVSPLRKANPGVPRDLETIVMKSLEHKPAHRYATGQQMAEDLQRFLDDKPVRARRISGVERAWRWSRRNPVLSSSLAAVASLLVFLAVAGQLVARKQTAAREATEQLLLVSDMNSAAHAWENSDLLRMSQALERHRSQELRGFAWNHLWEKYQSTLRQTRLPHDSEVHAALFSPDGNTLITTTEDTIRLWDLTTRKVFASRAEPSSELTRLAVSFDGKTLASGSRDGSVTLWDLPALQKRRSLSGFSLRIEGLTFSPDATTLAAAGWAEGGLRFWDVESGNEILSRLRIKKQPGISVTFSPDSENVVAGSFGAVYRWELPKVKAVEPLRYDNTYIRCVAVSPDGKLLAMGGDESVVRLHDLSKNQLRVVLEGHLAPIYCGAFSPDGRLFATGSADRTVRLWEVETGRQAAILRGHTGQLRCLAFSPDGTILASGSIDHSVILWDLSRREPGLLKLHQSPIQDLAFSPDSTKLVSVGRKHPSLVEWDVDTEVGEVLTEGELWIQSAAFSPTTNMLVTNLDSSLKIWDLNTRTGVERQPHDTIISSLAFSPNGKMLACATPRLVRVWNTEKWCQITPESGIQGPRWWTTNVAFSPNGKLFATPITVSNPGSRDFDSVRLYDTTSWEGVRDLGEHYWQVVAVAFSPNGGTLATAGAEGKIIRWDLATMEKKDALIGETSGVYCLAFSPDGKTLVSGGVDSRINVWNLSLKRPQLVATLKGHTSSVRRAVFSSDGRILATASYDGTVRLWRTPRADVSSD